MFNFSNNSQAKVEFELKPRYRVNPLQLKEKNQDSLDVIIRLIDLI